MSGCFHIPVMVEEVMEFLRVFPGGFYVDCTLGGGGHSLGILERGGRVLGIDRDPEAVTYAAERLRGYGENFRAEVSRFSEIADVVGGKAGSVDGIIMDLGVSSRMIDEPARGFSYRLDGPLLMTMGQEGETAYDVLNSRSLKELVSIFRKYGEEPAASRIARAVVEARSRHPIETTRELAEIIERTVGGRAPQKSKARIFQALRIHVNREIEELRRGLEAALSVLGTGGRLCVISYHSVEDRIVKDFMRTCADPCVCPPDFPECRCGRKPVLKLVARKPVRPSREEVEKNPRARSARLRVGEKLDAA